MIDLHCHLLPGIDDGPQTLDESLQLARIAVKNGITHSVVTPHILPGRYDNDSDSIAAVFERFREALRVEQIPLQVAMAAEVRLDPEIIGMIAENRVPFLGEINGYKIILLEFPHGHPTHHHLRRAEAPSPGQSTGPWRAPAGGGRGGVAERGRTGAVCRRCRGIG